MRLKSDTANLPLNALHAGRNKIIINHLEKLFVTNDAATIIRELEVVHPAAKLLVLASQQQEAEVDRMRLLVYQESLNPTHSRVCY